MFQSHESEDSKTFAKQKCLRKWGGFWLTRSSFSFFCSITYQNEEVLKARNPRRRSNTSKNKSYDVCSSWYIKLAVEDSTSTSLQRRTIGRGLYFALWVGFIWVRWAISRMFELKNQLGGGNQLIPRGIEYVLSTSSSKCVPQVNIINRSTASMYAP